MMTRRSVLAGLGLLTATLLAPPVVRAAGWTSSTVWTAPNTIRNVTAGPGRNDSVTRLYATNYDGRLYEFSWTGSTWSALDLGLLHSAIYVSDFVAVGAGRNDGTNRVYATSSGTVYEFTWSGSSFTKAQIGGGSDYMSGVSVGPGRSDGATRVYANNLNGSLYEFSWSGSSWTQTTVGSLGTGFSSWVSLSSSVRDASWRVYAGNNNDNVYEFTWTGSSWTSGTVGGFGADPNVAFGATGRNDGTGRLYLTGLTNRWWEYTWTGSTWAGTDLGDIGGTGRGIAFERARHDGTYRLYIIAGSSRIAEATWTGSAWSTATVTVSGAPAFWGLTAGAFRGDGVVRLYPASDALYEVTYDTVAPPAPGSPSLSNPGTGGRLSVYWVANTEADIKDYGAYRSTYSNVLGTKLLGTRLAHPGTTHQDAGLVNGTTYYYQITARDVSLNESGGSSEVSAYPTSGADTTPPAAVTFLTAATQDQIKLSWTAPSDNVGVTAYLIRYSTLGAIVTEGDWSAAVGVGAGLVPAPLAPGTTQTAVITGLRPRTTHYFAIKSQDAAGNVAALDTSTPEPNASAGSFVMGQEPSGVTGPGNANMAWGDYDNDGDLDLVVKGNDGTGRRFRIYRNDAGTFNLAQEPAGAATPLGDGGVAAWGDYDRDGDLDLAVNGYDGTTFLFRVYRNDGGTFVLAQEPAGSSGPGSGSVAWGDYDNDGDLDLAVNGWDGVGRRFRIYRNDGGTFNLAQEPAGTTGPGHLGYLAWGDYDNDGDLDLVIMGEDGTSYRFRVYRNDGGAFNLAQEPSGAVGPGQGAVNWGDYDNDGDLDLAINGYDGTGQRFRIYRNDSGTFLLAQEPAGAAGPGSWVEWGDYDNDGDLDLAVNGNDGTGERFRVYRNDAGTFTLAQEPAGTTGPGNGGLAWGDYDNDGDLDLAVNGWDGVGYRFRVYKSLEADQGNVNSAPAAPSGLSAAVGTSSATFIWAFGTDTQSPTYGLYYQVRVSTIAGGGNKWVVSDKQGSPLLGNYLRAVTTSPAQGRFILKGLTSGTTYYWATRTIDAGLRASVWSGESNIVTGVGPDTTPPAAPTGLGAAGVGSAVNLSWTANTEGDLKDYLVRRATFVGVGIADPVVATIAQPGTTHQDGGLAGNTTYFYRLSARDTSLNESGLGVEVSTRPTAAGDTTPPAAPTGLGVSQPGVDRQLNLSWTANTESDLSYYRIYRATTSGAIGTKALVTTVNAPTTSYQDGGLQDGTTYYYQLTAVDTSVNASGATAEASGVTRGGQDTTPPAAISNLTALVGASDGQVGLTWTAPGDDGMTGTAATYELRRATYQIATPADYGAAVVVATASWVGNAAPAVAGTASSTTIAGLNPGVTYYFSMKARDEAGNLGSLAVPASNWAPAQNGPPNAPATPNGSSPGGGIINLSWTANTEADIANYRIWRATFSGALGTKGVVAGVAAPGTTHQDAGLTQSINYFYQITARDTAQYESGGSGERTIFAGDAVAPSSPTALGVANQGLGGRLNLSWAANSEGDLKDYRTWRSTFSSALSGKSSTTVVVAPGTTHQDAGLTNGTSYFYQLTARDTSGNESAGSPEVYAYPTSAADTTPPAAPGGLGAADVPSDEGGALRLSWVANTESDRKDYGVYRGTATGALGAKVLQVRILVPGTTHQDSGLVNNGPGYFYQLTARDTSNNESAGSAEGSAAAADNLPPQPPVGVATSTAPVSGRINVRWSANTEPDLASYTVYRATFSGGVLTKSPATGGGGRWFPPGTTHQDYGLTDGVTYYYQLTARDLYGGNESSGSVEVSGIPTGGTDTTPPGAPTGFGVANPGLGGALRLSWVANTESDLKDYRVYRSSTDANSLNVLKSTHIVATVAAPGTTHQDAGLINGTTYYYRITARDTAGNESPLPADFSSGAWASPSGPPGMTWAFETVDSTGNVGGYSQIAIDAGGNTQIAYHDTTNLDARWAGQNGGGWILETVDTPGYRGAFMGLGLDAGGAPFLSYADITNGDLRFAQRSSPGSWPSEIVDSTGSVGNYTSIAVGGGQVVHIAYYDATNQDLKYAKRSNTGVWTVQTVDSAGDVGGDTGMTLDAAGNPYIAYFDSTNGAVKLAYWTGSAWSIQTVDSTNDCGHYARIALSSTGTIHIVHWDFTAGDLRYAQWNGSAWSLSTIDTAGDVGRWPSIALDGNGNPHVSYYDYTNGDLKYARWTGTSWNISAVDSASDTGQYPSIAIGSDGNTRISYYDATNGDLRHARVTSGGGFPVPVKTAWPTGVSATAYTSSITWTWTDNASNEQGYRVRSATSDTNLSGDLAVNTVSWTESGLPAGTYKRYVQVFNAGGVANSTAVVAATSDTTPPGVPTGFGVANPGTGGRLNFSWVANTEPDLRDYRIYCGLSSGPVSSKVLIVTIAAPGTTHQEGGQTNGTAYYFQVTARDTSLNESGGSVEVSATPTGSTGNYLQVTSSASATAGVGFNATVVAKSSAGVTLSSATDVVTVTTSDLYDSEAGYTGALSSGTRVFSITLVTASTVTITAAASGYTSGSTTTVVSAGAAAALQVLLPGEVAVPGKTSAPAGKTGAPVSQSAGVAFTATVNAVDAWWNMVANASPTVTVVTSDPNDGDREPLPAPLVAGTRLFSVAPITLGNVTVTASATGYAPATSASALITNATPPSAPSGLTATPQEGATIRLAWTVSTSADVTTYRIYYATATSLLNFAAPSATVAHPTSSWVSAVLTAGQTYSFVVRAVNASGNEETNANVVTAQALATLAGAVRARVAWPLNGNRVAGARMTVIGEVIAGADRLASIRFDYRPEASSTWTVIPPAVAGFTNPDATPPYFVQWDMRALPLGNYRLRAVAADRDGNLDPAPAEVSVVHVAPRDVDLEDTVTSRGERQVRQVVRRDQDNRIRVGDERGEVTEVRIPAGALVSSQTVVRVVLNPVDVSAGQAGLNNLGRTRRITFEDGTRVLSSTFTVRVAFRQDAAGNIQGTRASPRALLYCRYNPALRRWQWVPITAVFNSTRRRWEDARGNEITPAATRFGAPALASLADAAPDTSVVEAETNQDGDYALFLGAAENLDTTLVYPNPFKPNSDATHTDITFANLTEESTVEVLTVAGERVWMREKVIGRESWPGTNETGEPVTTGVYVYVITSKEGQKSIGKLAVIR